MTRAAEVPAVDIAPLTARYAAEALEFKPRPVDSILRAIDVVLAGSGSWRRLRCSRCVALRFT